eukprot:6051428-Pleurochrysis_carterae.AAC.3
MLLNGNRNGTALSRLPPRRAPRRPPADFVIPARFAREIATSGITRSAAGVGRLCAWAAVAAVTSANNSRGRHVWGSADLRRGGHALPAPRPARFMQFRRTRRRAQLRDAVRRTDAIGSIQCTALRHCAASRLRHTHG